MRYSVTVYRRLVWLLAFLPGLLMLPFLQQGDISTAPAWFNTLGRLTGIWGLSFMLLAAALCCRVPGFDRPFGGLTKLWQLHHRLAGVAFLFLLAHPLLLAFASTGISLEAAVSTLFSSRAPVLWGWVALLSLMLFMAPSFGFFGDPEYQRWKFLHRLSGVAVVFALVHTLMLARTWPDWLNITVWSVLAMLALTALAYRWGYARWQGRQPYRVVEAVHPARDVVELTLRPEGKPLHYQAGQFVYLTPWMPGVPGHREEHPYTLSSAPTETDLRLAIKDLGDASRALQTVALDTAVWVEGPYGSFFPDKPSGPELWIAGGIGVTPFLGRIREAISRGQALPVHLIDCVQDETRFLFGEELEAAFAQWPDSGLSVHYFYREGPLDADYIEKVCPDFRTREIYLCGPLPLLEKAQEILTDCGVPSHRIVSEEFVLL